MMEENESQLRRRRARRLPVSCCPADSQHTMAGNPTMDGAYLETGALELIPKAVGGARSGSRSGSAALSANRALPVSGR